MFMFKGLFSAVQVKSLCEICSYSVLFLPSSIITFLSLSVISVMMSFSIS